MKIGELRKRCSKCGEYKVLEGFSKKKSSQDGFQYECKQCVSGYCKQYQIVNREKIAENKRVRYQLNRERVLVEGKKYREVNREKIAKRDKAYSKTHNGKAAHRKATVNYRENYPEKWRAHDKVMKAVRSRRLKKPFCCVVDSSDCSDQLEAHHEDYSKPLEVIWLCAIHHRWVHR